MYDDNDKVCGIAWLILIVSGKNVVLYVVVHYQG